MRVLVAHIQQQEDIQEDWSNLTIVPIIIQKEIHKTAKITHALMY